MKVELRRSYPYAFLLDEQELRRIYSILTQQIGKVVSDQESKFQVKFKNNVVMQKTSLDEYFTEQNGDIWAIQELEIILSDRTQYPSPKITLEFSSRKYSSTI